MVLSAPPRKDKLRPEASKSGPSPRPPHNSWSPHCYAFLQHLECSFSLRSINLQVGCFVSVLLSFLPVCPGPPHPTQARQGRLPLPSDSSAEDRLWDAWQCPQPPAQRQRGSGWCSFSRWETEAGESSMTTADWQIYFSSFCYIAPPLLPRRPVLPEYV